MFSPSGEYAESRPFKIFISLLDKWEIGAPLTEVLVYDALKAVKHLMEHPVDTNEDVSISLNFFEIFANAWCRFQQRPAHSTKLLNHNWHGSTY